MGDDQTKSNDRSHGGRGDTRQIGCINPMMYNTCVENDKEEALMDGIT